MDRTPDLFDAATTSEKPTRATARKRKPRAARAGWIDAAEAARRVLFEAFAASIREEIAPASMLERIFADRVVVAAWRLRESVEAERASLLAGLGVDSADLLGPIADDLRRRADRDARLLRRSLDSLAEAREDAETGWGRPARLDTTVSIADECPSDSFPVIPFGDEPASTTEPRRWQDRLIFDPSVSEESPVVKGTWITVSQVVSRIVDGATWSDLLRAHPELNEDDIRACLGFATEQDDDGLGLYLS